MKLLNSEEIITLIIAKPYCLLLMGHAYADILLCRYAFFPACCGKYDVACLYCSVVVLSLKKLVDTPLWDVASCLCSGRGCNGGDGRGSCCGGAGGGGGKKRQIKCG